MSVAATSILSLPLDHARTLLSHSSTWQSWVRASDATEAEASIHLGATPPPADGSQYSNEELRSLWPLAVISLPPDGGGFQAARDGDGTELVWPERGRIVMGIEDAIASHRLRAPGDALVEYLNELGGIMRDMLDLSGTDDGTNQFLWLRQINILDGPTREDLDAGGAVPGYHWTVLDLSWGFGS